MTLPAPTPASLLRSYYSSLGYRVHSGLQFGVDLVLYADDPSRVHSDFAVVIAPPDANGLDFRRVQSLARAMPDLHKKLVFARAVELPAKAGPGAGERTAWERVTGYAVEELRIMNFHRSFKTKQADKGVGGQKKKQGGGADEGGGKKRKGGGSSAAKATTTTTSAAKEEEGGEGAS